MNPIRTVYEHLPRTIEVPPELRDKKVEITLRALDEEQPDEAWSPAFLAATMGAWEGLSLERGTQCASA